MNGQLVHASDPSPIRRVLVTGAAGLLGSKVVERLSSTGKYEILATDLTQNARSGDIASLAGVDYVAMDLRDRDAVETLVSQADAVVHLAGVLAKVAASNPALAFQVNVGVTHSLLCLSAQHSVQRFVYGSSQAVYGTFQEPQQTPFREEDACLDVTHSPYGSMKTAAEALLNSFRHSGQLNAVALRLGVIYGPGASPESNAGLLRRALVSLDDGDSPLVPWTRESQHALIFVDDAADAVVRSLELGYGEQAFNVMGPPVSSEDLYPRLVRLYGGDPETIAWTNERTRYQLVSAARMKDYLEYEPRTTLEEGLRSVIAWHRSFEERP